MSPNKKTVKNLSDEFILKHLMGYYASECNSFNHYCKENAISSKRVSLSRVMKAINLQAHKDDKKFTTKKKKMKNRTFLVFFFLNFEG